MGKLFTVGHSQHTPEYFINLLKGIILIVF